MRSSGAKIIGAVIIVLVLMGLWGYHTWLRPDPSVGEQLAEQFGDDFFVPGSLDSLPATEKSPSTGAGSITENFLAGREKNHATPIDNGSLTDKPLLLEGEKPAPQITEKDIIDKYAPKFSAIEQFTNSRLDQIYAAAEQEYGAQSRAGTLNHAAWTQKYLQACLKLQDSVNPQFYSLVNEMEAELKANNLSTNIIDDIKQEYTASKYQKIKELLARAHGE